MQHDLARRSVHAVLWSYFGAAGKIAAQLVIQVFLARMLGPVVFGQYAAVLIVIGIGWLLADSGFGAALVQKKEIQDKDVSYVLGWVLLLSTATCTSIVFLAPWIARAMGDASLTWPIMACGPIVSLQALSNISASILRRNLDMKRNQIIQLTAYVIGFGVIAIGLALLGLGVWSLVIGFLAQTLITLIAGYSIVRHSLKPTLHGDSSLRKFGFGVLATNVANWSIESLDRFFIGRQWGITALGNYSAAANLSRVPVSLLVNSLQAVTFSSASRAQENPNQVRKGYNLLLTATSLLTFPLATFLAFKANLIINLLYGDKWLDAGPLFAAFCIAIPFYVLLSITGPLLWAIGRPESEFKPQLISAIFLLSGLFFLKSYPLNVAVWIIPVIYFIRFGLVYSVLYQHLKLSTKSLIQASKGGAIMTCMVIFIETIINHTLTLQLESSWFKEIIKLTILLISSLFILRTYPRSLIGDEFMNTITNNRNRSNLLKILHKFINPTSDNNAK
ncbi:lipopolysaccharide biosynthesis protein [Rhodoferax sp. TS-BS-61-7]|uniref:lipopolysaccharide biosynthesis protein n=1 Tax=Rhodoferax sp. TS-BS-61-7 TaxID=2094194 RepID=UPI000CF606C5|nr:lipopolysaccharide biosynthesis protein [Rhodoferax sp. TS-BS-61-7]PQA77455.1 hypothetical protein C5F53_09400 [Rhodoferax sp. TS-BS-61-7]